MAKKNPIKKREQGSQKPNPNTPGNPKKYMGDAEWEQYNEPQGVNSPAAKRIMKKESFSSMVDKEMKENFGGMDGDLGMMTPARMAPDKTFTDPITDPQSFEKIGNAKAPTKAVKRTVKKSYQDKDFEKELAESNIEFDNNVEYLKSLGDQMQEVLRGTLSQIEWASDKAKSSSLRAVKVREWLKSEEGKQRIINDWVKDGAPLPHIDGMGDTYPSQGDQFMDWTRDYIHDPRDEWERQQEIKNQGPDAWGAYVKQYMAEMVRVPVYTLISGDYEVRAKEKRMGHARVVDGVIAELICSDSDDESYRGEVLTNLLKTIIEEADLQNSPLSLQLADRDDEDMKRFLERFGFRAIGHGVMQRMAGAVSPPSVQYTDGMEDEELDR